MKTNHPSFRILVSLCAALALTQPGNAATNTWSGAAGNLIWHTAGNWLPSGPPGGNDDTLFFNSGATNGLGLASTVVTNNTAVRSVWVGPTNGIHNLVINSGATLTVAGTNHNGYGPLGSDPNATSPSPDVQSTYYVGTKTGVSLTHTVTNTVSGGGTLSLNNPNNELNVRQFWQNGGGAHMAVLEMSGLDTFVANLGRIRVGDGEAQPITRAEGQLFLARTNTITLSGTNFADNVQLLIGNNDVNNNGNGRISYLFLGQQTALNVDEVLVGGRKSQGNISFNAAFTAPALTLRGSDGLGRVRALRIGDHSDQLNTGNAATGNMNLGLGSVNALVDTVYVARSSAQQTGPATGTLTLGTGTFDVNNLEVAYQTTDQNTTSTATGTLNVNGTTVIVNNLLRLGRSAGSTAARTATLNINGGSVTATSSYLNEGTVNLRVTNGVLALPTGAAIIANNLVVDGGTITSATSVRATNTLVIANSGTIPNNPIFDMGNSGTASWDVEGATGSGLTISNALQGSGNYYGNLTLAPSGALIPGGNNAVGTLAVQTFSTSGNITLNGGMLRFDLTTNGVSGNDQITASGTVTLNATNDVNITALGGLLDTANPYTLLTAGTLVGNQTYFKVAGQLAQSRYAFVFDTTSTPNAVQLSVSGGFGNLAWVGDGTANLWNLQGAFNWNNGSPAQFLTLDAVTFTDAGSATPYVNMVGSLVPGSMTVNNPTKHYGFGGSGGLAVSGELIKSGAGNLTITNNAANSFSSLVTVSNGAVTIANNGVNTFASGIAVYGGSLTLSGNSTNDFGAFGTLLVGSGAALTLANSGANSFGGIPVQLDGTFTLNQPVDATMNGQLTGGGILTKSGSGTLTLGGNNSGLTSIVQITGGRVRAGVPNAIGSLGATIANGGQLNLSGQNLSTLQITAAGSGPDGSGAIINNGGPQESALGTVTLTGHTALGGSGPWSTDPVLNSGRMDLNGGALLTGNQPYNLTKVGLNQVTLRDASVDAALANIDVQAGLLALQGGTSSLGNPTNTLSVQAGGTVSFFDTGVAWDKKIVLFGNGATPNLMNYNGVNVIAGPVTLNSACVLSCVPASRGTPLSLSLSGPVGGTGSLIKSGHDVLILAGTNGYTGTTTVSSGTLQVDGVLNSTAGVTVAGGSLGGTGIINGNLVVNSGGTLAPGASAGKLTVNGTVTLQGTTRLEINRTGPTNDLLQVSTPLAFGGTLVVTNIGSTLLGGESFDLFNSPGLSGAFTTVQLPPLAAGLSWNTSQLNVTGTISVTGTLLPPAISSLTYGGTNVIVNGTQGAPNGSYFVLTSIDVTLPLASWEFVATNTFDALGNFSFTNTVDPGDPQRFYRIQLP
jgi:autotransporter-associated beta strand protein